MSMRNDNREPSSDASSNYINIINKRGSSRNAEHWLVSEENHSCMVDSDYMEGERRGIFIKEGKAMNKAVTTKYMQSAIAYDQRHE